MRRSDPSPGPNPIARTSLLRAQPPQTEEAERVRRRSGAVVGGLVAGAGMFAAYSLVLAALSLAPAAPVAAVRESSVVIAAALGAIILRERVRPLQFAGGAAVAVGVALLAAQ